MQRQRSPFTGANRVGGLNLGGGNFPFNAASFSVAAAAANGEGLNGMPFLAQPQMPQMLRSLSRQRLSAESSYEEPQMPDGSGGQRFVPRSSSHSAFTGLSGPYEGDPGPLKSPNRSLVAQLEACPLLRKMHERGVHLTSRDIAESNDTDSEPEEGLEQDAEPESLWQRACGTLMSGLPPQRQRQVQSLLGRCRDSLVCSCLLALLQLLSLAAGRLLCLGDCMGKLRLGLWRWKFQLRSTMRELMWRMTNAKASDTMLFLVVVLGTPWLFLIGLIGFAISFPFTLKASVAEARRQLRLRAQDQLKLSRQ